MKKGFVDSIVEDPRRAIVWAVLILIIGLVVWFAWKKVKNVVSDIQADNEAENEIKELEKTEGKATITTAQAKKYAQRIKDALGGSFGDDEDAIYAVFAELNTAADIAKIKKEFGIYKRGVWFDKMNLEGNLRAALRAGELKELNQVI